MPDTKVIKAGLAYRAKYQTKRQAPRQNLRCLQVVPHPKNRGGDVIRVVRTKGLIGEFLDSGYCPTEATVDLVAVEIDLDSSEAPSTKFSDHFRSSAGMDPDHYYDPRYNILFAGLSHNSKNLAERNLQGGMPGCACEKIPLSLDGCNCKAKPILDDTLKYSMDKLKKEDPEWYNAILCGTEWDILSSAMDKEEPTAAHIIAIALNQTNKVAMSIGQVEILRTLKSLCNPDPRNMEVPYHLVEAQMVKSFGSTVYGAAYLYPFFELVRKSGGQNSKTMKDFFNWADIYIDESRRMVKPETYGILVRYPPRYRNIIKMQLKHTWSQKPIHQLTKANMFVPLPTSIAHRLDEEGGKYAWPDLMKEVEDVGYHLPKLSSTVVEKNTQLGAAERAKTALKWHSEV